MSTTATPLDISVDKWGLLWRASFRRLGKTSHFYAFSPARARAKAETYRQQESRFLGPLLIDEMARRGLSRPPMQAERMDYPAVEARFPGRLLVGGDASCSVYEDQEDGHFLIVEPVDERQPLTALSFADVPSQLVYESAQGFKRFPDRAATLAHLQARRDARQARQQAES